MANKPPGSNPPPPDRMSEVEYARALKQAKNLFIDGSKSQSEPIAVILAGQPGSGKGRLAVDAEKRFVARGGSVLIDPDQLRERHPRYPQLAKEDYTTAATRVHPDAKGLADDLLAAARNEKRNIIYDTTLSSPDKAEALLRDLKKAGYRIHVEAMATNPLISQRGVAERLERGLAAQNPDNAPRTVPPEVQQAALKGLPSTLERIERLGLADEIRVHSRGGSVLYDSAQPDGNTAKQALVREQTRPMNSIEITDHARGWDKVAHQAETRAAPPPELAAYHQAQTEAHGALRADPVAAAGYDKTATPEARARSLAMATRQPPTAPHTTAATAQHPSTERPATSKTLHLTNAEQPPAATSGAPPKTPTHPAYTDAAPATAPKVPAELPAAASGGGNRYVKINRAAMGLVPHAQNAAAGLAVVGAAQRLNGQLQIDLKSGNRIQQIAGTAAMAGDGANAVGGTLNLATRIAPSLGEGAVGTGSRMLGKAALPIAVGVAAADGVAGYAARDPARVAGAGGSLGGSILGGIVVGAGTAALLGAELGPFDIVPAIIGGVAGGIVGENAAKQYATGFVGKLMPPKKISPIGLKR